MSQAPYSAFGRGRAARPSGAAAAASEACAPAICGCCAEAEAEYGRTIAAREPVAGRDDSGIAYPLFDDAARVSATTKRWRAGLGSEIGATLDRVQI